MITAVADTHAVIWYLANGTRLSTTAQNVFEYASAHGDEIAI